MRFTENPVCDAL